MSRFVTANKQELSTQPGWHRTNDVDVVETFRSTTKINIHCMQLYAGHVHLTESRKVVDTKKSMRKPYPVI